MHDDASFLEVLCDTGCPIILPQPAPRFHAALSPTPRPRGHTLKIAKALDALAAAGQPLELLRECEIIERCDEWLEDQGLNARERPHRSSYMRFLRKRSK